MSLNRILRPAEVRRLFGDVSNTTLYRWVQEGKLPPPVKLVESGRAAGWPENVIEVLLNKQQAASAAR